LFRCFSFIRANSLYDVYCFTLLNIVALKVPVAGIEERCDVYSNRPVDRDESVDALVGLQIQETKIAQVVEEVALDGGESIAAESERCQAGVGSE
jgi:hypothetical protein